MILAADISALRAELAELAADDDPDLDRYVLKWPRMPSGFYRQLRWFASLLMRGLEASGAIAPPRWPVSLKQAHSKPGARAYLIWAVEVDRDELRDACQRFVEWQRSMPQFAPVLVTDVADFAFFSRLGWLVEYLPTIAGEGDAFESRKARFLARNYQDAPVIPWNAGLLSNALTSQDVASCLANQAAWPPANSGG